MEEQLRVKCTLMRGGTSKAVFLNQNVVPKSINERSKFLLALFGSPDSLQVDGLGGADIRTSKCAIIGPPSREDADIDYTFVQVGIENAKVDYNINCGNISAAVGVYAIEEGFILPQEPMTKVRIHNTNTNKMLIEYVPVKDGKPLIEGDYSIDGVPGTGAELKLDYSLTGGSSTGNLLPTGNVKDPLYIPSLNKSIEVSIVDLANTSVFIRAEDIGMKATEQPNDFSKERLTLFEEIKREAAKSIGLPEDGILPWQAIVSRPKEYEVFSTGKRIKASDVDLCARITGVGAVHKAYAGTVGCCTAVAAKIEGTVVHEASHPLTDVKQVRIGHPSGVLPISVNVRFENNTWRVKEVMISRTGRRLMEGYAYIRKKRLV